MKRDYCHRFWVGLIGNFDKQLSSIKIEYRQGARAAPGADNEPCLDDCKVDRAGLRITIGRRPTNMIAAPTLAMAASNFPE